MKKSKSVSKSKKKSLSTTKESKKKKIKSSPHLKEKGKPIRKSRWEETKVSSKSTSAEVSKKEKFPDPILAVKKEKVQENFSRIEDFLNEKEKLVELLFLTITGTALEEIIPDYLKKRPLEELKKLCLKELKNMPSDMILNVISGKVCPLLIEKETQTEDPVLPKTSFDFEMKESDEICKSVENSSETSESDVLELYATSNDMSCDTDDENQAPNEVLEEVAKDLGVSAGDAELLELEMRARAIRSLLKQKTNETTDSDIVS